MVCRPDNKAQLIRHPPTPVASSPSRGGPMPQCYLVASYVHFHFSPASRGSPRDSRAHSPLDERKVVRRGASAPLSCARARERDRERESRQPDAEGLFAGAENSTKVVDEVVLRTEIMEGGGRDERCLGLFLGKNPKRRRDETTTCQGKLNVSYRVGHYEIHVT